jgi:EAL domain-containing protein (putative c-di-GMP-specific phosphodiesterase class I)
VLEELGARFSAQGALGVVRVDAAPLAQIENRYGHRAHSAALEILGQMLAGACDEVFGSPELVAAGETGRSEVTIFICRPPDDIHFFGAGLPSLALAIRQRLERHGQRVVYPYLRQAPRLAIGWSYVMRNPLVSEISQIREALEEARRDAELDSALAARELRREFMELLIAGSVRSVYEPVVDSSNFTVFGYEALVRGPEGSKFASPATLFGLAEQEGLLFELDCLCRRKGIEGAHDFPPGAKLFLNIRPTAIHDPSFQPDALTRTLDRCGLSPAHVVFEISEQESIENYQIFREARDAYGRLGFQFALDDTGAGYSSLEAVMELSPEFIKVDRAFVSGIDQDPARQNMARAFQAIARDMNARLIGEGLDTLEELQMLARLGIPFGQGWLFGKPAPLRASGKG